MAGAHPGGAGQILFIKPVVAWTFAQVAWERSSAIATIAGPRSCTANRRNGNRPLDPGASLWTLVWLLVLSPAGQPTQAADHESSSIASEEPEEAEDNDLRQRLTEREDKRRPLKPWSADVAGRPLTLSGEYEIGLDYFRRRVIDTAVGQPDRWLLEQGLEAEAFYSFGRPLSLFAQLRVGMEEDLLSDTVGEISTLFVERGEMWLYSENIAASHRNLDFGRLKFEDERRWWWDEKLDALRVS